MTAVDESHAHNNTVQQATPPAASGGRRSLLAWLLVGFVRAYQWTLSPFLGGQCRFQPTCSRYFIEAVDKYGAIRGGWKGTLRILRCHPWHPGGHDPP